MQTSTNLPGFPFILRFNHNGSDTDGSCVDAKPDRSSPGALRFFVRTQRMFGMLPDERVQLLNNRGDRCNAKWENAATSLGGLTNVEFVAVIPDDWFSP